MGFRWTVTPASAWGMLADAQTRYIRTGVLAIAHKFAPILESYAKENGHWQDQTGNLRATLQGEVEQIGLDMVEIIIAHGMDYGIWVELRPGFGVINETIDVHAPQVWADVVALVRR